MNRFILSILSLAVAVSVGACNKNNNPRTKPVPGPTLAEKEKPVRHDDDDAPPKKESRHDDVVNPTPAHNGPKVPPPPVNNPEYASKAEGKPGYVTSPYDPQHRLIDVRGLPPGTEAECPYTRRTFLVPP